MKQWYVLYVFLYSYENSLMFVGESFIYIAVKWNKIFRHMVYVHQSNNGFSLELISYIENKYSVRINNIAELLKLIDTGNTIIFNFLTKATCFWTSHQQLTYMLHTTV